MSVAPQLSAERLDWHLWNWARWMDGTLIGSGHRNTASGGAVGYGSMSFEEMCARSDAICAEAVNAAIEDLPLLQKLAVHHVIMASVFRMRGNPHDYFEEAKPTLARTIYARGIV